MTRVASWHNKALLSDNFSAALQNFRRARRYVASTQKTPASEKQAPRI
jgi:hypothetical protein